MSMFEYVGQCACGRVEVRLSSELTPGQFQPRSDATTCAFCKKHDGVWISDPNGKLRLRADETRVERFASDQVAFHFCGACGTLVYARFEDVAVVSLALFEAIRGATAPIAVTNFEDEPLEAARARRRTKWTPIA